MYYRELVEGHKKTWTFWNNINYVYFGIRKKMDCNTKNKPFCLEIPKSYFLTDKWLEKQYFCQLLVALGCLNDEPIRFFICFVLDKYGNEGLIGKMISSTYEGYFCFSDENISEIYNIILAFALANPFDYLKLKWTDSLLRDSKESDFYKYYLRKIRSGLNIIL